MDIRPALAEGDIEDINQALKEIIDSLEKAAHDPKNTEDEQLASANLKNDLQHLLKVQDPVTKITMYRQLASIVNKEYVRRFGKDESSEQVDKCLQGN